MPEDQKSGFSEAVETGASAAHTIRGAIKTGKAISSAAKGAAAGGPYGAVAGAVWAGRKHIGKIIVAVIALLMLPVLFVLMLPGLIFGGLTNAFSPSDPEIPILNSETAIIENANEITFTLNGILGEALDDVLARIEADFAASGADHMEVKNAYSGGPIYNANLFISQYCAAKDKDFESISLNDLAATLRENKQHLYSYTSKQEIRESTVTDPETGEETTEPETWMVYTVRYNGESYFSDVVFQLTDDQKELAADYASNLSLFLGDGLLQNLEAWTGNSITSLGDVTFTDGITPVVYYNQLDERYAGKAYRFNFKWCKRLANSKRCTFYFDISKPLERIIRVNAYKWSVIIDSCDTTFPIIFEILSGCAWQGLIFLCCHLQPFLSLAVTAIIDAHRQVNIL